MIFAPSSEQVIFRIGGGVIVGLIGVIAAILASGG
jgi:3-dehydroquinate synthetase